MSLKTAITSRIHSEAIAVVLYHVLKIDWRTSASAMHCSDSARRQPFIPQNKRPHYAVFHKLCNCVTRRLY